MAKPELIDWRTATKPVEYEAAVAFMEDRVEGIRTQSAPETVWLLEHPPLYTAGTSASAGDLLEPDRFPVHRTGRGGQYTYHGPGQRVGYVMLDLNKRGRDVRAYVHNLEEWIIATLAKFDVQGERRDDRVGIWIDQGGGVENKIAAIGVRIRRWITFHGIAINVNPDLTHFTGIVPCGINAHGVTSLHALGVASSMDEVDAALRGAFDEVFGSAGKEDRPTNL
ncbi:MAG: lipoyl(octanoyl) transferase LipB [Alphaproteobacteria bacterium]|nr:lipoyl(octanoyl) transferase LipB [Alphaproteobacteria bacterium]